MYDSKVNSKLNQSNLILDKSLLYDTSSSNDFVCPLCKNIVWQPIECKTCKQQACLKCIQDWLFVKQKTTCPISGCEQFVEEKLHPFFVKQISMLKLKCQNFQLGCDQVLTYDTYEKHILENCPFSKKKCPNEGCEQLIFLKDSKEHQKVCIYQQINCKYCQVQVILKNEQTHLEKDCQLVEVSCTNKECTDKMPRKDLLNHLNSQCLYRIEKCKWCQQDSQPILLDKHLTICEKVQLQCEICQQWFGRLAFKQHDIQECIIEQVISLKQENIRINQENIELSNHNEKIKQKLVIMQEKNVKIQKNGQDIVVWKKVQAQIEIKITEILNKELLPHILKKHNVEFDNFEAMWHYFEFLNHIYIIYWGWHKLHCWTCLDFITKYYPEVHPLYLERLQILNNIKESTSQSLFYYQLENKQEMK